MGQRELLRLHEHAARAAARVIDAALVRLDHLDQHPNHRLRGEELAAALALGAREAGQEILIDPPQQVLGLVRLLAQRNARDQVDQFAEHHLVERRSGILLGQHTLERSVRRLDRQHRVVDQFADGRLLGVGLEVRPAGILRNPEDVLGRVFVLVLGVGILIRQQSLISSLEGVRDVFQEDQAEDDVLVFRRVHVVAELVGGSPELGFEAEVGGAGTRGRGGFRFGHGGWLKTAGGMPPGKVGAVRNDDQNRNWRWAGDRHAGHRGRGRKGLSQ